MTRLDHSTPLGVTRNDACAKTETEVADHWGSPTAYEPEL